MSVAEAHRQRVDQDLLARGIITPDQLRVALLEQDRSHTPIHKLLTGLGFVSEAVMREALEASLGSKSVDLGQTIVDPRALALLPKEVALHYKAIPLAYDPDANLLTVAVADPSDILLLDQLRSHTSEEVQIDPLLAGEQEIFRAIDHYYGHQLSIEGILQELETGETFLSSSRISTGEYEHPVVRLVNALLVDAVKQEASDIHFEPEAGFLRIRYRIDGILRQIRVLHRSNWGAMAVRLKVITGMNIAETRAPQDGRVSMHIGGRAVDFRASVQPTIHGENIVLRILDRQRGIMPMAGLGLNPNQLQTLEAMMARPEGILLVTGPTGSGKTTTLYSLLSHINNESVNIMTLEDPVEYPIPLIRQTSVAEAVKLDFASGIRSMMRQDPDVILVGEIRDTETAEMAFRAAMTGHQVFATLHTNSAIGAIPRLSDIGVRTEIMSGNLIGIIAQRLVRRLCKECKEPYHPNDDEVARIGLQQRPVPDLYRPRGCPACHHQGYRGRVAIMELLRFTPELDDLTARRATRQEILQTAKNQGFSSLAEEGVELAIKGVTSLAEIARVVDLTQH
ncbi:MAG TPA: GspE/PulE family protein [Rhodocyclaceae bacterium]|nr:GspE/PulE family protein [Rhodocyclaceae bacterium]